MTFIEKVLPEAKLIVLTRHPLAILSSGASTFYGGDYGRFYYNRDVLGTFIPPIAKFMRDTSIPYIHVRYEDLVSKSEYEVKRLLAFLDLDCEQDCINFGKKKHITKTYGDPNIDQYEKPVTASLQKWVMGLVYRRDRRRLCEHILRSIPEDDISMYGYPIETVWTPLDELNLSEQKVDAEHASLRDWLAWMKWSIVRIAQSMAGFPIVTRVVRKLGRLCDALLKHR
ncbi:MAG: sulfotransferase [Porticoccus sp.]